MRILVVGGTGFVGNAFVKQLRKHGFEVDGTYSTKSVIGFYPLNLIDLNWEINFSLYTHCIIAGGVSGRAVNDNLAEAYKINVQGTQRLISQLKKFGIHICFISSSSVFALSQQHSFENDSPNPKTYYGKQKRIIETILQNEIHLNYLIIRPTKVLSNESSLIRKWTDPSKKVFFEANRLVTLAPISTRFLVETVIKCFDQEFRGVLHVSNKKEYSYDEFAEKLISLYHQSNVSKNYYASGEEVADSATILRSRIRLKNGMKTIQDPSEFWVDIGPAYK